MTVKELIEYLSKLPDELWVTFSNNDMYENGRYSINDVVDMGDGTVMLESAYYCNFDDVYEVDDYDN